MSGNQAINVNYGVGGIPDIAINNHGSDWYFTVCAVMGVSTLAFMGLSFTKPLEHRIFHYMTAAITLIATIAYFAMGAGLGQVPIQVEFTYQGNGTREIFYARYIDWVFTTPLLLLDILLTGGLPWPTILITILADEVMIATGLIGALTQTSYKWGFFTFGCVAFLYVAYQLVVVGRSHAKALGSEVSRAYNICGLWTVGLWFLYPISFGLSEGGNVIGCDGEAVFYGVLDIMAKPVFGALLLWGHRNIDPAVLGLRLAAADNLREKNLHNGAANGTNGHHDTTGTNGTSGVHSTV